MTNERTCYRGCSPNTSPSLTRADTHQARVPPTQWQGARKACGQRAVARQKPMEITGRADSVAAKDVNGLIQSILHLALL